MDQLTFLFKKQIVVEAGREGILDMHDSAPGIKGQGLKALPVTSPDIGFPLNWEWKTSARGGKIGKAVSKFKPLRFEMG